MARWWEPPGDLDAKYGPAIDGTEPTEYFVVEVGDEAVGLIQRYRHCDHGEWDAEVGIPGAVGIDYLLGDPAHCGRGLGTRMIAAFLDTVRQRYPDAEVVVAAPQEANVASCSALEKAGFTRREVRQLASEGPWDAGPSAVYVYSALSSETSSSSTASKADSTSSASRRARTTSSSSADTSTSTAPIG